MFGAKEPHSWSQSSVYGSLSHTFDILCQSIFNAFSETCCYRKHNRDCTRPNTPPPPQIMTRKHPSLSPVKKFKATPLGRKLMITVFWRTCRCAWAHTNNQTCDSLCCYSWKVTHHPLILQPVFSISLDPLKRPGLQVICNKHQC
jgi:hypothetical protein